MEESLKSGLMEATVVPGLIRGTMNDGRNLYDRAAKRELVRLCLQPGVSLARTARVNGVNANLLRKWVVARGRGGKVDWPKEQDEKAVAALV